MSLRSFSNKLNRISQDISIAKNSYNQIKRISNTVSSVAKFVGSKISTPSKVGSSAPKRSSLPKQIKT